MFVHTYTYVHLSCSLHHILWQPRWKHPNLAHQLGCFGK